MANPIDYNSEDAEFQNSMGLPSDSEFTPSFEEYERESAYAESMREAQDDDFAQQNNWAPDDAESAENASASNVTDVADSTTGQNTRPRNVRSRTFEEFNDDQHVSLADLVRFLHETADSASLTKEQQESVQANLDMHFTRNQLNDLTISRNTSNRKVYDARTLKIISAFKRSIDDRGWVIQRCNMLRNGEEISGDIEAGGNKIRVTLVSPAVDRIGTTYMHNRVMYRNQQFLHNVTSPENAARSLIQPLDFLLGNPEYARTQVAPTKSNPNKLKVTLNKASKNGKNGLGSDGVFYIVDHRNNQSKTPSYGDVSYVGRVQDYVKPHNLAELITDVNRKALESGEEVTPVEDLLKDNGRVDLSKVNTDQLMRYAKLPDVVNLIRDQQLAELDEGRSLAEIRNEVRSDHSKQVETVSAADQGSTDDGESGTSDGGNSDVVYETKEEQGDNAFAAAFKNVGEDIGSGADDEDDGATEDSDEASSEPIAGSRQRITNLLAGMEDANGNPVSGILPEEQYTSGHKRMLELAKESAEAMGITDFKAVYDNDSVMHWSGLNNRTQQREAHKIGQFFFPAEHDITDKDGNILVKKNVIPMTFGSGQRDLRVANFDGTFMAAREMTPEKMKNKILAAKKANEEPTDNYRHSLLTRLKLTSVPQKMTTHLAAAIKAQILFRSPSDDLDDSAAADETFDSNRMNKIYQGMTRLSYASMLRPHVVDQARSAVRFDNSWLHRSSELRAYEKGPTHREPAPEQSIRGVLDGLEGVFDEQASSDGKALGLKRYLTEPMMKFLEEHAHDPESRFLQNGTLGSDGMAGPRGHKKKTILQEHFLEIPIEERRQYRSALANAIPYSQYDSPDRALMAMNMLMVAKGVIGGPLDIEHREKPHVALMTAGGGTFEDSIVLSKAFAEKEGLIEGDKLADLHSNKGTVGYIAGKSKDDPGYNADIENLLGQNTDVDVIMSPYSMGTRANMGLAHELEDGDYAREIKNPDGSTRGIVGDLSLIVTNMTAEHKVRLYGLQDLGRTRHFSYQQMWAVAAHNADGVMSEVFKHNERSHENLMDYANAVGMTIDHTGALRTGHFNMKREASSHGDYDVEVSPSSNLVVSGDDALKMMPETGSYMELPLEVDVAKGLKSRFVPILPIRLRHDTESYDGQYIEHDYQTRLDGIASMSSNLESMKMDKVRGIYANDETKLAEMESLYKDRDAKFMDELAANDFNDEAIKEAGERLKTKVGDYVTAVAGDQFGTDARGVKHSYIRRHIVAADLPDSSTTIATNDPTLPIDTVALSPALAANLGLVEPIDKTAVDKALASNDIHQIQEAYRGNWKPSEHANDRIMAWRDPILHDGSIAGFKYEVRDNLTGMAVNGAMTQGFGQDFDGDQMGLWRPTTPAAQSDLRNKMAMGHHMLDADGHLNLNFGMDVIDNFSHSSACKKLLENGQAKNAKGAFKLLTNRVVDNLKAQRRETVSSSLKTDDERKAYKQALSSYMQNGNDSKMDANMKFIWKRTGDVYKKADTKFKEDLFKTMNQVAKIYLANEGGAPSQYVDFRTPEGVKESLTRMMDTGAKGNPDALKRAMKYYTNGVNRDDNREVREALAAKVELTGRSGAQFLRLSQLMGNDLVDMNNSLAYNGACSSLDITEPVTQSVVQIKHDPSKVPAVMQFLQDSRKFTMGPRPARDGSTDVQPVWIRLPKNVDFRELAARDMPKNAQGNLDTARLSEEQRKELVVADRFDKLIERVSRSTEHMSNDSEFKPEPYVDINTGECATSTGSKRAQYGQPTVVDPRIAYSLAFRGIYEGLGLDISKRNADAMQNVIRDPQTGMLKPYEENVRERAGAVDELAMGGYGAMRDLAERNDEATFKNQPDKVKSFGASRWSKFVSVDYYELGQQMVEKRELSKGSYRENLAAKEAQIKTQLNLEAERQADDLVDNALGSGLNTKDAANADLKEIDNEFLQNSNPVTETKAAENKKQADFVATKSASINSEVNTGKAVGPDMYDSAKGTHEFTSDATVVAEKRTHEGKPVSKSLAREAANMRIIDEVRAEKRNRLAKRGITPNANKQPAGMDAPSI